jgi:cholesterol transport system auxiliary component
MMTSTSLQHASCGRRGAATGAATGAVLAALLLSACSALPSRPERAALYDFGPGASVAATAKPKAGELPPLALAEVETAGGALENSAVLYRLAYANAQEVRPYSRARWSVPAPQLVRQQLREVMSQDFMMLNAGQGAALTRVGGQLPPVLRVNLDEFSHFFESETTSYGLVRLRVTLVQNTPAGEVVVGERRIEAREKAATADAAGGVAALRAATTTAGRDVVRWLNEVSSPASPAAPAAR